MKISPIFGWIFALLVVATPIVGKVSPNWVWVVAIPAIVGVAIIGLCAIVEALDTTDDSEQPNKNDYWMVYGIMIKQAYASKFGGENTGFNQEVDQHVGVMLHNGQGYTKGLAEDWLKRMHKFTEGRKVGLDN